MRQIAAAIGRPPSTVSREIARHGGRNGYRAADADTAAWERARRPKRCRLAQHVRLQRIVAEKLRLDWSPEQIAGWLRRTFPHDETMRVSHETIYRSLFVQARGVPETRVDQASAIAPRDAAREERHHERATSGPDH